MTRRLGSIRRRGFAALASASLAAALAGGGALIGCGGDNTSTPPAGDGGDGGQADVIVADASDATMPMDSMPPPVEAAPPPTLAAPTFNPPAGAVDSGSTVAITCPGVPAGVTATIYYSTDMTQPSSDPLAHSLVYSGPIQVTMAETIRALCAAPGFTSSPVAAAAYTLKAVTPCSLAPITFSPGATTLNNDSLVTLTEPTSTCDAGASSASATICFTISAGTTGATPTCDANAKCNGTSLTYSAGAGLGLPGSVTLNGGITDPATGKATVQAIACEVGHTTTTPVVQTYTLQAATPTMQGPAPGMLGWNAAGYAPTMASATNTASLRFTTTGTPPDCTTGTLLVNAVATPINPGALPTATNTTYSGIACKPGYAPSGTANFAYTIQLPAPGFVDSTSTILGGLIAEGTGTYDRAFSVSFDPTPDTYTGPNVPAGIAAGLYACYTTNGMAPACGGADGTCSAGTAAKVVGGTSGPAGGPTAIAIAATGTVVKAVACSAKFTGSASATATYTLQLDPPSLNPPACTKAGVNTSCTVTGTGAPLKSFQLPAGGWPGGFVEESFGAPPPSAAAGIGPAYGAVCAIKGAGATPACMGAGCAAGSTAIQPTGAQAFTTASSVPLANGGITPAGGDTWNFIGCPPVTGAGSTFAASTVTSISFAAPGVPLQPTITPGTGNNTNAITPVLQTTDPVATTMCYTLGTTAAPPAAPACSGAAACTTGTAVTTVNAFGSAGIGSLTLVSGGTGYTSAPTVTVAPSNGPNGGNQAQFTATLGFSVASIGITSGGSGCAANMTLTLPDPTGAAHLGAAFTAIVSGENNAITGFTPVANSFLYTTAPVITIGGTSTLTGGCNVNPVLTAVLAAGGSVVALPVVSTGTGYGAAPAVTITGGGGSGASATANPNDSVAILAPLSATGTVINAVACVAGPLQSSTASATYTFTLATPDITDTSKPAPVTVGNLNGATTGAVTVGDTLVVSTTSTFAGEQLCVSTDGSAVDCTCTATAARGFHATPYTVPGAAVVNGASIKAIACNGTNQVGSGVQTATLALSLQPPVFSPVGGTYEAAQTVTLSAQGAGNTICYGVNGSATCNGAGGCATGTSQAVTPIPVITQNNTVINAITCNGANASAPSSATYKLGVTPVVLTNNPATAPSCPASSATLNVQFGLDCALGHAGGPTPPGDVCGTVDFNEGAPTPTAGGSNAVICYSTTSTVSACQVPPGTAPVTCFDTGVAGTGTTSINLSATTTISAMACLTGASVNFTSSSSTLTLPFNGFKTGARVVDGVLTDWATDAASTSIGSGAGGTGYFAYDGANFDFAYQGTYTAATANQTVLFYVGDAQASGGTNTVITGTAPAGTTLPAGFDAKYAIGLNTATGAGTLYAYNTTVANAWNAGTALAASQIAQAGSAVEVQVPYATLGSITTPTVLGVFATAVGQAAPMTGDWWPNGAGGLPYVHYYMDNINSCLAPNSTVH